jgi:ABC-type enterochelin transport system permease subunit
MSGIDMRRGASLLNILHLLLLFIFLGTSLLTWLSLLGEYHQYFELISHFRLQYLIGQMFSGLALAITCLHTGYSQPQAYRSLLLASNPSCRT